MNKKIAQELDYLTDLLTTIDQCDEKYNSTLQMIATHLFSHKDALYQLVQHGPIEDGDGISKSLRDDLIRWKLASRGILRGSQGYTYATYRGWNLLKILNEESKHNCQIK